MRTFRFSLQKLMDIKEALEKAAEIRLRQAIAGVESNIKKLNQLQLRMRQQVARSEKLRGTQTNSHSLSVDMKYLHRLERRIAKQTERILKCERDIREIREELQVVIRERKSLERLKKRERQQWITMNRRNERNEMDEIAATAYSRRRQPNGALSRAV